MTHVLPRCECTRCSHEWIPRKDGTPKVCPACHAENWSSPDVKHYYGFGNIELDEEVLIPWFLDSQGYPDEMANKKMNHAVTSFSSRTGRAFMKKNTAYGLLIKRIK